MASNTDTGKTLIYILIAVVVIAVAFFAYRAYGGGGGGAETDASLKDLPQKPADLGPVSPEQTEGIAEPIDLK